LLTVILIFSSCNPEDGLDGAMGPQGPEGIQGPKGDPGENVETEVITAFGKWEVTNWLFRSDGATRFGQMVPL